MQQNITSSCARLSQRYLLYQPHHTMPPASTVQATSGIDRWKYEVLAGFVGLSIIYASAYTLVQHHDGLTFSPAPQYCHGQIDKQQCSRPDLFAFQVSGFVSQIFLAGNGYMAWHRGTKPATSHQRLFGYLPSADRMNAGILVYQLWDFVFSLAIPEHATPGTICSKKCSFNVPWQLQRLTGLVGPSIRSLSRSSLGSGSHGILFFGVSNVPLLCQLFWRLQRIVHAVFGVL